MGQCIFFTLHRVICLPAQVPTLTEADVGGATATFYSWMEGDLMFYEISVTSE